MTRNPDPIDPERSLDHLLGAALRHWRDDVRGLGLRDLAKQVFVDYSQLSKWERGDCRAPADAVARIDEILAAGNQLVALHATVRELGRARSLEARTAPSAEEDALERRALLQLLAVLGAGSTVPAGALEVLRHGLGSALPRQDNSVEDWERVAYEHACSLCTMAPAAFVATLAPDILELRRAIDARPELGQAGMSRVAAQLAALMAMGTDELGDVPSSRRWWRTARQSADASGDRDLQVYVRGRQAGLLDAVQEAPLIMRLVSEAKALSGGHPGPGLAEALDAHCTVLAVNGNRSGASHECAELRDLHSRLPASVTGEQSAVWGWPERRVAGTRKWVRLMAGDPAVYEELPAPQRWPDLRGQALGDLGTAWARIVAGDVRPGLEDAVDAVAKLPPEQRTKSVLGAADRVRNALPKGARALRAAQELQALTSGGKEPGRAGQQS